MTDYRDPNRPDYRDPNRQMDGQGWSTATWGWIAGIAIVVLILVFAFGIGGNDERVATDTKSPATTGQRSPPPAPPTGAQPEAPRPTPPATPK
jgi:hypothetical protein